MLCEEQKPHCIEHKVVQNDLVFQLSLHQQINKRINKKVNLYYYSSTNNNYFFQYSSMKINTH